MLEKINYEKGQVFDKDTDNKIQQQLDERYKREEIGNEYEKLYDTSNLDKAENDLIIAKKRIEEIDGSIHELQRSLNDLDQAYEDAVRDASESAAELKNLGLFDDIDDIDDLLSDEKRPRHHHRARARP